MKMKIAKILMNLSTIGLMTKMSKAKSIEEQRRLNESKRFMSSVNELAGFWKLNPHRMAKDYLNLNLYSFQQIILNQFFVNDHCIYVAARGQGKSFLLAVFCVVYCILFPGTKIVITSRTREQSIEVIQKIINDLCKNYSWGSTNLKKEIQYSSDTANKAEVLFWNASEIRVATSVDTARHFRANIIICDEYRMIPQDILRTVIKKFLATIRLPGFKNKNPDKYKDYVEPNKEIYASSAWEKAHWSFQLAKSYLKFMIIGKKYFICDLPYQVSIKEGMLQKEQIVDEMQEATFDQDSFDMEMKGIWRGNKNGAWFKYTELSKRRLITEKFPTIEQLLEGKAKVDQPIGRRILSVDVALMTSNVNQNDASSIMINDAILTHTNIYNGNFKFAESDEGLTTDELGLKIMRYYYMYACTDIALDTNGNGLGVYDFIIKDQFDKETGKTYPALSCINNDEMAKRCKIKDAKKVIWSIKATSTINHECAILTRNYLQNGRVTLLSNKYDGEEYIKKHDSSYSKLPSNKKLEHLKQYIEFDLLVTEMTNLVSENVNGLIKLKEKSGFRKDRYSSFAYNCYVMNRIEMGAKPKQKKNKAIFGSRKPKMYKR